MEGKISNMTTTLAQDITVQTVTIPGAELSDLLTGALVASAKGKDSMPALAGVYLSAFANQFTVIATDRFRLIRGKTKAIRNIDQTDPGELYQAFIPNDTAKDITKAIKNVPMVRIVREGLLLTIHGSTILSFSLQDQTCPPIAAILEKISGDFIPTGSVCLDPKYLADMAKVPSDGNRYRLQFHGDKQPVSFDIHHELIEWTCLLMPMRDN